MFHLYIDVLYICIGGYMFVWITYVQWGWKISFGKHTLYNIYETKFLSLPNICVYNFYLSFHRYIFFFFRFSLCPTLFLFLWLLFFFFFSLPFFIPSFVWYDFPPLFFIFVYSSFLFFFFFPLFILFNFFFFSCFMYYNRQSAQTSRLSCCSFTPWNERRPHSQFASTDERVIWFCFFFLFFHILSFYFTFIAHECWGWIYLICINEIQS